MLSAEMLTILGGSAVLPYVVEAIWCWIRDKNEHRQSADTPRKE